MIEAPPVSRPLPDDETAIFGRPAVLTERELISIHRPIGPDGEWVAISFVQSRVVE